MRSFLTIALAAVALLSTTSTRVEERHNHNRDFLGLWQGVDLNDGSLRSISITDRERDGILEVAARDTYWTLCLGDRGIEIASGRVQHDGVLITDGLVMCFETGDEIPVQQTYEYSRREETLFATAVGTGLIPVSLHRVSE